MAEKKVSKQVLWAVEMANKYLAEKRKNAVGIRRLHYFIVSLPESERQIPAQKGLRTYDNSINDYKRLSALLVEGRISGLIGFDKIIDEKNDPIIDMPPRTPTTIEIQCHPPDLGYLPELTLASKIDEFDEYLEKAKCRSYYTMGHFKYQPHRICVAIEKATSRSQLERLCQQYGADLLIFSGQFSVTRVNDLIDNAIDEDKPIVLLYISDLDCAGWIMPSSFFRRIGEIYPNTEHIIERVALTRDQAVRYHLPTSFDPDDKSYPEAQKNTFITESGGRECIELDALDEDVLVRLLEDKLKEYANLESDTEEYNKTKEYTETRIDELDKDLDNGLKDFESEYKKLQEDFNPLVEKIEDFQDEIEDEKDEMESKQRELRDKIDKYMENKAKEFQETIRKEIDEKKENEWKIGENDDE
jgi:hypothetical protein